MELQLFWYDMIVQVNLLSRNPKKPKKIAEKWLRAIGNGLGDDWGNPMINPMKTQGRMVWI